MSAKQERRRRVDVLRADGAAAARAGRPIQINPYKYMDAYQGDQGYRQEQAWMAQQGEAAPKPPASQSDEQYERHTRACTHMTEAEENLHSAMAQLKSAAMLWVRVEAEVAGDAAKEHLINIAASCQSAWGGGHLSENNIIEAAQRREALELLRRIAK